MAFVARNVMLSHVAYGAAVAPLGQEDLHRAGGQNDRAGGGNGVICFAGTTDWTERRATTGMTAAATMSHRATAEVCLARHEVVVVGGMESSCTERLSSGGWKVSIGRKKRGERFSCRGISAGGRGTSEQQQHGREQRRGERRLACAFSGFFLGEMRRGGGIAADGRGRRSRYAYLPSVPILPSVARGTGQRSIFARSAMDQEEGGGGEEGKDAPAAAEGDSTSVSAAAKAKKPLSPSPAPSSSSTPAAPGAVTTRSSRTNSSASSSSSMTSPPSASSSLADTVAAGSSSSSSLSSKAGATSTRSMPLPTSSSQPPPSSSSFSSSSSAAAEGGRRSIPMSSANLVGTRTGLFRAPISGGVQSATSAHGLPSPALAVRNLIEQAKYAHLCTVMSRMHHRRRGYPFGSLVDFSCDNCGHPIFCLSPLAIHTRNLLSDPRCTLVVQIPGWSGLANARVTIFGDVHPLPVEEQEWAQQLYLAKNLHGPSHQWGNFNFFRMDLISDIYFVGGFGTVAWVDYDEYASVKPDKIAITNAEDTLQALNDKFSLYLKQLLKIDLAQDIDDAAIISIDGKGIDIRVRQGARFNIQRMAFEDHVDSLEEATAELVRIVHRALRINNLDEEYTDDGELIIVPLGSSSSSSSRGAR